MYILFVCIIYAIYVYIVYSTRIQYNQVREQQSTGLTISACVCISCKGSQIYFWHGLFVFVCLFVCVPVAL